MGNEDGTKRGSPESWSPLKKVIIDPEINDFCANFTAHLWIHTAGEV
jgi:hypothetical protein